MLNDYEIALLLQQQYDEAQGVFDVILDVSGVYCSVKYFQDFSVICFRGSTTILDWCRDFQGIMVPDAELGGVEQGFITGLRDIDAHIDTLPIFGSEKSVIITGHSLGAARALLFAGMWTLHNQMEPGDEVVVFGSPRPGGMKLKGILAPLTVRAYCNGRDPVCRVPLDIPLIDPYCEPCELIMLDEAPTPDDVWGGFIGWHHLFPNYGNGVKKVLGL